MLRSSRIIIRGSVNQQILVKPIQRTCFTTTNSSLVFISKFVEPIAKPKRAIPALLTLAGIITAARAYKQSQRDELKRSILLEGGYQRSTKDMLMSIPLSYTSTSSLVQSIIEKSNQPLDNSQQNSLHKLLLQTISSMDF